MDRDLVAAIVELNREEAIDTVRLRVEADVDPMSILEECREGMRLVGERFQEGEYFLAELLLSAKTFKSAVDILEPHLAQQGHSEPRGTVVLATTAGDIHDLGKNILGTLLRAQGFEVHDLGVDVAPERLVAEVDALRPDIVGLSALITTAFASMKATVDLLEQEGLRDQLQVAIGGGVTTPELMSHVGADFQTTDATAGVAFCIEATQKG